MVSRTEALGFVERVKGQEDGRLVRLALTAEGETCIQALTAAHLSELKALGPRFRPILDAPDVEQ